MASCIANPAIIIDRTLINVHLYEFDLPQWKPKNLLILKIYFNDSPFGKNITYEGLCSFP